MSCTCSYQTGISHCVESTMRTRLTWTSSIHVMNLFLSDRDLSLRRVNYGNETHVNISIHVMEDNRDAFDIHSFSTVISYFSVFDNFLRAGVIGYSVSRQLILRSLYTLWVYLNFLADLTWRQESGLVWERIRAEKEVSRVWKSPPFWRRSIALRFSVNVAKYFKIHYWYFFSSS